MDGAGCVRVRESIEICTVLVVKNRCQFCYAFFRDQAKVAEHSVQCMFRFSETFEAIDGRVKYACAVCFDVFPTKLEHKRHEHMHRFPGGFPCTTCNETFLNEFERAQHIDNVHGQQRSARIDFVCNICHANFEQESYLRLHSETNCGRHGTWSCIQCNLLTKEAYQTHMKIHHKFVSEEEVTPPLPKDETLSDVVRNIRPIVHTEADSECAVDPLLLAVKEEPQSGADAAVDAIDDHASDGEEFFAEEYRLEAETNEAGERPRDQNSSQKRPASPEKKFKCDYCRKRYFTEVGRQKHVVVHGPNRTLVHRCEMCPIYFETLEQKNAHKSDVHKERLTCKSCDAFFHTLHSLECHKAGGCRGKVITKRMKLAEKHAFQCNYCEMSFAISESLYRHKLLHGPDGSLVHKCVCCFIHFATKEEKDAHTMAEHKDQLTCDICQITFVTRKTRLGHNYTHHKKSDTGKSNECAKCGESFPDAEKLKSHSQANCASMTHQRRDDVDNIDRERLTGANPASETQDTVDDNVIIHDIESAPTKRKRPLKSERKFVCSLCDRHYSTKKGLELHGIVHGPDGSLVHKCDFCPIHFVSVRARQDHHMSVHKEKLTCTICDKVFQRYNNRTTHGRHAHSGKKQQQKFVCTKCGVSFSSMSILNVHEESACGTNPRVECTECGKFVINKHSLKTHMRIHTGERKFECEICKQRFYEKSLLLSHIRSRHTHERPFKCSHCEKSFTDKALLSLHTHIHTGIKRYVCGGCGQKFPTNSALHKHRKSRKDTCALVPIQPPLKKNKTVS